MTVSECCLIKLLPYILFEKYIYILALEMASPGNQHYASCIGTLSFPVHNSKHNPTCGSATLYLLAYLKNRIHEFRPHPMHATRVASITKQASCIY